MNFMTDITPLTQPITPIFYSFRRCPHAMRARLAIATAGIMVELREIELRNKPEAMLAVSPKGTVQVLQFENGSVIDESLDIMLWALDQNDPERLLEAAWLEDAMHLIHKNDGEFKTALDRYKYADRTLEYSAGHYRQQGEVFLSKLESRLNQSQYFPAITRQLCVTHFPNV